MAYVLYADGVGGSTGAALAALAPLLATNVVYVDSVTGSDSYDGLQRSRPKATLAGANAIAANGTTIVLLSTHSETISSVETISLKCVSVVGEGSSDGYPTATIAGGNNARLMFSGDSCQLINVKFSASSTTNGNSMVGVTGKNFYSAGCKFELGASDNAGIELSTGADFGSIGDCTFIATNTGLTTRPSYGFLVGAALNGVRLTGTVFSDGTYGFTNYAAQLSSAVSVFAENVSLLLGAEINSGSSYGYIHVGESTGGGRVV